MIATVLRLTRTDIKAEKITDLYSLHRVVYDLFEDVRSPEEKKVGKSSGILFVDKGGNFQQRQILILSDRPPRQPLHGTIESKPIPDDFLDYDRYRFELVVNPVRRESTSRKLNPIKGRDAVSEWFIDKAIASWGFTVDRSSLQINKFAVRVFEKKGNKVTLGSATLQGYLTVSDRKKFITSFRQGVGKSKAFGFGLLQIVPVNNPFKL